MPYRAWKGPFGDLKALNGYRDGKAVTVSHLTTPTPGTEIVYYTEDTTTNFNNPERGWIVPRTGTWDFANLRSQGYTVVWASTYEGSPFRLDAFRYSAISTTRLNQIRDYFQAARNNGLKIKVRFAYNGNPIPEFAEDASEAIILQHITQLTPIFEEYEDVITMLDHGFIGKWGEQHSSTNGLSSDTPESRQARSNILNALLDALPVSRMIGNRYPPYIREAFPEGEVYTGFTYNSQPYPTDYAFDESIRFNGSDRSRVGWLNDCFLSGESNTGTYSTWDAPQPQRFILDRATFSAVGPYTVASAETCGTSLNEYNESLASIAEMELMGGPDLLNREYSETHYNRWISEGYYDEITRRLGYRISLLESLLPNTIIPGQTYEITLKLKNSGFGKMYNPRPLNLVFVGSNTVEVTLESDCRLKMPLGGQTIDSTFTFVAPAGLIEGQPYSIHLKMPDNSVSTVSGVVSTPLVNDVRYMVRLSNVNMWDAATGRNSLNHSVSVVSASEGDYTSDPFYNSTIAFRGAVGYGANATGGRGDGTPGSTQIMFVDNLNDSGPGSLREALTAVGKRIIVPRVSGYVPLASRIEATGDFTFLGQLAPGGFGIRPDSLPKDISAYLRLSGISNAIVRYLTVRSGENSAGYTSNDCVRITNSTNIIVDHVSASYATDEIVGIAGSDLVTVQNCLISYPLEYAGHPETTHGYAALVYNTGRTTMYRNLISSVRERVPEVYATEKLQWVGNVIYNSKSGSVLTVQSNNILSAIDFQRNTYKAGPWTDTDKDIRFRNRSGIYNRRVTTFLEGNASRFVTNINTLSEQQEMARVLAASPTTVPSDPAIVSEWVSTSSVGTPTLPMLTASQFYSSVLSTAGNNLYRDFIDSRAVSEATNTTGPSSMYTSASSAGGYPALDTGFLPTASDGIISDAWRSANEETREWYEIDSGGTGRMIIENYADDMADGVWVESSSSELLGVGSQSSSFTDFPKTLSTTIGDWYVDPNAMSNGVGSFEDPFNSLESALSSVSSGETILVRAGTLYPTTVFYRTSNWIETVRVFNYGNERPVIDCTTNVNVGNNGRAVAFDSSSGNEHWKGFEVKNATNIAFDILGQNIKIEDMWVHECGKDLSTTEGRGMIRAYRSGVDVGIVVQDCVVWNCGDGITTGTNAPDCYQVAASTTSSGVSFVRCFGAHGADDVFDLWGGTNTLILDCVAYKGGYYSNGLSAGDGSGFKMGGSRTGIGNNFLVGSIAIACKSEAIKPNSSPLASTFLRNTCVDSDGYGWNLNNATTDGNRHIATDNIDYNNVSGPGLNSLRVDDTFNSWNLGISNPSFANTSEFDWSLSTGSPAISSSSNGGNIGASNVSLALAKKWIFAIENDQLPVEDGSNLLGVGSFSTSLVDYPKTGLVYTGDWWVDPKLPINGNGSQSSPFNSLSSALSAVQDGQRILVRSGTIAPTLRFNRSTNWTTGIEIFAYGNERPVLDCVNLGTGSAGRILNLYGRREHWKGFEVINGKPTEPAILLSGPATEYTIEDFRIHDCIGDAIMIGNFSGENAGGNLIMDTWAYRLGDGVSVGTNTGDAYTVTASVGSVTRDNVFVRCLGANGPDDNYDLFRGRGTRLIDCVSIGAGYYWNGNPGSESMGDGAGFKMGGSDSDAGNNYAIGCISIDSRSNGFAHNEALNTTQSNPNIFFQRCTSYGSGLNGYDLGGDGANHLNRAEDCISFNDVSPRYIGANATEVNNTWTLGISDPDFSDAATYDFSLAPTSSAIAAGISGGNLGASEVALNIAKEWFDTMT
jgi:hypothetical protein